LGENKESDKLYRFLPGALRHIAFALQSRAQAEALRERLRTKGVAMTAIYDQGSIENYIFIDNNGIQLEAAWKKEAASDGARTEVSCPEKASGKLL
jgi:hypothetical protein